jgi:hypothetical protein
VSINSWTIAGAAEILEVHPFEVVRLLATDRGLPADLRVRADDLARLVAVGGLEAWWQAPDVRRPNPGDLRPLAAALLSRGVVEPTWTRADNLYRGLDLPTQRSVRRSMNDWIRSGVMGSRMTTRGLEVTVRAGREGDLPVEHRHPSGDTSVGGLS